MPLVSASNPGQRASTRLSGPTYLALTAFSRLIIQNRKLLSLALLPGVSFGKVYFLTRPNRSVKLYFRPAFPRLTSRRFIWERSISNPVNSACQAFFFSLRFLSLRLTAATTETVVSVCCKNSILHFALPLATPPCILFSPSRKSFPQAIPTPGTTVFSQKMSVRHTIHMYGETTEIYAFTFL